ncbi:DUF6551 family protein [Nocardia sp. NPDC059240]|uniref:DUF6551 family protein n=1 Tax=Nocardia sp. NPDC059240 TaxID=3346786 RepID=UPI00367E96CF
MPDTLAVLDCPVLELPLAPDPGEQIVYVAPVSVRALFVDDTYQRELDEPRAKKMAHEWDPRLAGVIDISDRGTTAAGTGGRYAIINGQHRWAAATLLNPDMILVANVHTGLDLADEARLFYEIDARTRRLTGWDRWKSRRGAGDPAVLAIETVVAEVGLRVDQAPKDGNIRCVSTLEKVLGVGGELLVENTLRLIVEVWGHRLDAVDAPLIAGMAQILHSYEDQLDHERLGDVLLDLAPRQIKARALALRETETGQVGKLAALVMIGAYNSARGPKLDRTQLGRRPAIAKNQRHTTSGKDSAR